MASLWTLPVSFRERPLHRVEQCEACLDEDYPRPVHVLRWGIRPCAGVAASEATGSSSEPGPPIIAQPSSERRHRMTS